MLPLSPYVPQAEKNSISGIIKKRLDPFRGILKSRAKLKQNYDRFIVLGDADPKVVENRIQDLMKQNE